MYNNPKPLVSYLNIQLVCITYSVKMPYVRCTLVVREGRYQHNFKIFQFQEKNYSVRWIPVITAWHAPRLQMEERHPAMEGRRGQTTRGGPSAWGLGVELPTLHRKNKFVTKNEIEPRTWKDSLDKPPKRQNMDMRFGLWNVQSSMFRDKLPNDSFERTSHIEVRFSGSEGGQMGGWWHRTCRRIHIFLQKEK
jgi:hypothetical protein